MQKFDDRLPRGNCPVLYTHALLAVAIRQLMEYNWYTTLVCPEIHLEILSSTRGISTSGCDNKCANLSESILALGNTTGCATTSGSIDETVPKSVSES